MKAVIVCPLFPPEPVISARTSYDIANALNEKGHEVVVVTAFPNRPEGRVFPKKIRTWMHCQCRFTFPHFGRINFPHLVI